MFVAYNYLHDKDNMLTYDYFIRANLVEHMCEWLAATRRTPLGRGRHSTIVDDEFVRYYLGITGLEDNA